MNNRGFAISGIIYGILIMFLLLVFSLLGMLVSRKTSLDKIKQNALDLVLNEKNEVLPNQDDIVLLTKNIYVSENGLSTASEYDFSSFAYAPKTGIINYDSSSCNFSTMTVGSKCSVIYSTDNSNMTKTVMLSIVKEGKIYDINYTGDSTKMTLNRGSYLLETWGASGGGDSGGKGGYCTGIIDLSNVTNIYVTVGGEGNVAVYNAYVFGGYNGGGASYIHKLDHRSSSGGGATDIRINDNSLYARVMVAGGGAGAGTQCNGGPAGGPGGYTYNSSYAGLGATQTTAGGCQYGYKTKETTPTAYYQQGGFGYAGGMIKGNSSVYLIGGGGGWYGGGYSRASNISTYGGGGGSSYLYTSKSIIPTGWLLSGEYYLKNSSMIDGTKTMPLPSDSSTTETGHTGNGYARITTIIYGD